MIDGQPATSMPMILVPETPIDYSKVKSVICDKDYFYVEYKQSLWQLLKQKLRIK